MLIKQLKSYDNFLLGIFVVLVAKSKSFHMLRFIVFIGLSYELGYCSYVSCRRPYGRTGFPKSNMNSRLVLYFYSEVLLHEKCTIYIRIHTICRDSHKILGNWSNLSFWEHLEDRLGVAVDLGPSLDVAAGQG